MRCDGEEGDTLCGKYTSRTANVAQLCRYCECPVEETDDPYTEFPPKTTKKIARLVHRNDADALQQLSQQNIQNAMYKIRFGSHNKQGIHGACPHEILHGIHLGLFKYTRDCFFEQIGKDSKTADRINTLSALYGSIFS